MLLLLLRMDRAVWLAIERPWRLCLLSGRMLTSLPTQPGQVIVSAAPVAQLAEGRAMPWRMDTAAVAALSRLWSGGTGLDGEHICR